jgi:hypothetical protein
VLVFCQRCINSFLNVAKTISRWDVIEKEDGSMPKYPSSGINKLLLLATIIKIAAATPILYVRDIEDISDTLAQDLLDCFICAVSR